MNYCSHCGQTVTLRTPTGDDRPRYVCDHCDTVHYINPRIVTGCLATHRNQILLCRRAIQPCRGFWTLPAGFMENGETTEEGAKRECWEEARARIEIEGLYTLFNLPQINQVYFFYRGILLDGRFAIGEESEDVRLFSEENIPWEELAFPVVQKTLHHFFADRVHGEYPVRTEDVIKPPGKIW